MTDSRSVSVSPPKPKSISLSTRQRTLLHRLLHRKLRRCTTSSLNSFERLGWTLGLSGSYELTERGRAIAEISEKTVIEGELEVILP
jgi:hypothetical protein